MVAEMFNLSQELAKDDFTPVIREWISLAQGEFNVKDLDYDLQIKNPAKRKDRTIALESLVSDGVIERVGKKRGWYRPGKKDLIQMDYINASDNPVNIWLPFAIHSRVKIMPGNIIQINGEKNSGKTALMLNIARYNQEKWNVHYFNSEMGAGELRMRLSLFENIMINDWKINAYERSGDFADVIFPGEGNLNIIDFLEMHDEFYRMGEYMRAIHEKLKGAVAIIAIQKNYGQEMGLGGSRTEEKPRLILNISNGKLKVKMAKNWIDKNPNGKFVNFKLVQGCKFIQNGEWQKEKGAL